MTFTNVVNSSALAYSLSNSDLNSYNGGASSLTLNCSMSGTTTTLFSVANYVYDATINVTDVELNMSSSGITNVFGFNNS